MNPLIDICSAPTDQEVHRVCVVGLPIREMSSFAAVTSSDIGGPRSLLEQAESVERSCENISRVSGSQYNSNSVEQANITVGI